MCQEMLLNSLFQERLPFGLQLSPLFRTELSKPCGLPKLFAQTEPPHSQLLWAYLLHPLVSPWFRIATVFEKPWQSDPSGLPACGLSVHHGLIAYSLFPLNISCLTCLFSVSLFFPRITSEWLQKLRMLP